MKVNTWETKKDDSQTRKTFFDGEGWKDGQRKRVKKVKNDVRFKKGK